MTLSCSNGNFSDFTDVFAYIEEPINYLRFSNSTFGSFGGLEFFKQLKGLRLSATRIGDFQLGMLRHLEELEKLEFSEMNLVTFDLSYLVFNTKLEYMQISNNPGLQFVGQPELSLTDLDIRNCDLKEVPSALRNLNNLKVLLLENNDIDDATVVLEYFPNLVFIPLAGNPISCFDEAFQRILLEPVENPCTEQSVYIPKGMFNVLILIAVLLFVVLGTLSFCIIIYSCRRVRRINIT